MGNAPIFCGSCDKLGIVPRRHGLPGGWRRITVSNPDTMAKRGNTALVCGEKCGVKFVRGNFA